MKWLVFVLVAGQCLQNVLPAKILALCTVISHSHSLWCYKYMEALAEKGHQITVLGVDEPKFKIPNLTTFIADGVYEKTFSPDGIMDWTGGYGRTGISAIYPGYKYWNEASSEVILNSDILKKLIETYKNTEKPFDLIIHDNVNSDAVLALVPLFGNPPLLLATTFGSPQWMTFRAGNIFNPAYVPSMVSRSDQRMSFFERCLNTFEYVFLEWLFRCDTEPFQDKLMRKVFGDHLPHVRDIAKQANIVIVNYHSALNGPRPMLPGMVGIAGLHISEPKPLPQDIKEFMDGAKDGVILFSMGSNVDSNWLPKDFESTVVEVLGKLPQRVLWKWDKVLPNLPSNIRMSSWLPQGDILAHPKIRLFINHCGLLSTQEAVFRKVPVLAMPVFVDQFENAAILVRLNLAFQLNPYKLTVDQLHHGIKELLSNPMYKENIEKMGELMADMPQTAKQQAVFWTEYAIRHQGAPHLHSVAADMPWHQLFLLDVIAFYLIIFVAIIVLVIISLSFIVRKFKSVMMKTKTE